MKLVNFLFFTILGTFFFYSCEKDFFSDPTENQSPFTHVKVELIVDCTGSYFRLDGKDYLICNYELVEKYTSGSVFIASFNTIKACSNINPSVITCKMYHANEGSIDVTDLKLLYSPETEIVLSQPMSFIQDCSGSYLRYNNSDYQVCNTSLLKECKISNQDSVIASFVRIKECNELDSIIVCMLYHPNKGLVNLIQIEKK